MNQVVHETEDNSTRDEAQELRSSGEVFTDENAWNNGF